MRLQCAEISPAWSVESARDEHGSEMAHVFLMCCHFDVIACPVPNSDRSCHHPLLMLQLRLCFPSSQEQSLALEVHATNSQCCPFILLLTVTYLILNRFATHAREGISSMAAKEVASPLLYRTGGVASDCPQGCGLCVRTDSYCGNSPLKVRDDELISGSWRHARPGIFGGLNNNPPIIFMLDRGESMMLSASALQAGIRQSDILATKSK